MGGHFNRQIVGRRLGRPLRTTRHQGSFAWPPKHHRPAAQIFLIPVPMIGRLCLKSAYRYGWQISSASTSVTAAHIFAGWKRSRPFTLLVHFVWGQSSRLLLRTCHHAQMKLLKCIKITKLRYQKGLSCCSRFSAIHGKWNFQKYFKPFLEKNTWNLQCFFYIIDLSNLWCLFDRLMKLIAAGFKIHLATAGGFKGQGRCTELNFFWCQKQSWLIYYVWLSLGIRTSRLISWNICFGALVISVATLDENR